MEFKRRRRPLWALNITPLIDVVLLLLIFFMISSSFVVQPGIHVKLPQAASADQTERQDVVVILTEEGLLYVEDKQISFDELLDTLKKEVESKPNPMLVLKADEAVTHGRVVRVMDMAKQAGIPRIAIATAPKSAKRPE